MGRPSVKGHSRYAVSAVDHWQSGKRIHLAVYIATSAEMAIKVAEYEYQRTWKSSFKLTDFEAEYRDW